MMRSSLGLLVLSLIAWSRVLAADPGTALRGVLIRAERVAPRELETWKGRGANAVVVPLDESSRGRWREVSSLANRAGMAVWPWIEVGRNPAMADAHPDWMASVGGHHADWRSRFPDAPRAGERQVVKAWPWVPIGYAPALDAHQARIDALLADLPDAWSGVVLNDLQAGPSSCGCGNDQCRWALDYGTPPTAEQAPGVDAAARLVQRMRARHPGKTVVPVWVTECETIDLPGEKSGTGFCGSVPCARGACWPKYALAWNPLVAATDGPIAVALWSSAFRRDPDHWLDTAIPLFRQPPKSGRALPAERTVAVLQVWDAPAGRIDDLLRRCSERSIGWIAASDRVDQSWEPRLVAVPASSR